MGSLGEVLGFYLTHNYKWAEKLHEMWPNKDKAVKDLVSSYR